MVAFADRHNPKVAAVLLLKFLEIVTRINHLVLSLGRVVFPDAVASNVDLSAATFRLGFDRFTEVGDVSFAALCQKLLESHAYPTTNGRKKLSGPF